MKDWHARAQLCKQDLIVEVNRRRKADASKRTQDHIDEFFFELLAQLLARVEALEAGHAAVPIETTE